MDLGDLQGLFPGQVGQDGGQALGQHGFAGARRPHHQNVVAARSGNLQGTLHRGLPLHLGEVGAGLRLPGALPAGGGGDGFLPGEVAHQLGDVGHGIDFRPAGQGGLGGVFPGDEELSDAQLPGGQGHGQHPRAGAQLPGEGELPQKGAALLPELQLSPGGQQPHQDRQVIQGADLLHMGGCQIDGDPADREGEAAVFDGGAHPLPGLIHCRVRQADDGEGGQAAGQVALHRHRIARDAVEPEGLDRIDHGRAPP